MRSRILRRALGFLAAAMLLHAVPARAQDDTKKDVSWTLSGEARYRPEWRDDADLDRAIDDDTRLGYMRLRLGVSILYQDDYRIFIQVQDARIAGEEASPTSNEKNLDLHQGYFELKHAGTDSLSVALGRQEWSYGDQRLIGASWWSNAGRSFDGARLRLSRPRFWIDGFAARIASRADGAATEGSDFFGIYGQSAPRKGAEYEAYGLLFADHVAKAGETGALADSSIRALGVRAKDHAGAFDFTVEAVWEGGEVNGDDLHARAASATVAFTIGSRPKWRLLGGYDHATGDRNPADGKQEEFFNFFPTNHALYGYIDYQGWRNLRSPWGGVGVTAGRHYVQAKVHRFALDRARGAWKDDLGVVLGSDPAGLSGTSLGREIDLTWRFSWKEKASLEAGYANFRPDRFARQTRGEDSSGWAYLMLTAAF